MSMVTLTKANGLTTKQMALAFIRMSMELCTKASGKMTCNTEWELKLGWTVQSTRDNTVSAASTASAPINGTTALATKENGTRTRSSAWAFTPGSMVGVTKANGKTTTWRAWESTNGTTAGPTPASTWMTRSMASASTNGRTADSTRAIGASESNTGLESTWSPLKIEKSTACGKRANVSNGSRKRARLK